MPDALPKSAGRDSSRAVFRFTARLPARRTLQNPPHGIHNLVPNPNRPALLPPLLHKLVEERAGERRLSPLTPPPSNESTIITATCRAEPKPPRPVQIGRHNRIAISLIPFFNEIAAKRHKKPKVLLRRFLPRMDTDGMELLIRVYRRESVVQILWLRLAGLGLLPFSRRFSCPSLLSISRTTQSSISAPAARGQRQAAHEEERQCVWFRHGVWGKRDVIKEPVIITAL